MAKQKKGKKKLLKAKKPVRVIFDTKKRTPAEQPKEAPPAAPPVVVPMPTADKKVTDFEEELDRHLAGESPEAPKRGPGRPRKQEPEPEPQLDLAIVTPVVKMPFDLWALKNNLDELKINDKEAMLIAKPLKELLDYYLPKIPTIAYAWISLLVMGYTVLKPRLESIQKIKKDTSPVEPNVAGKGQGGPPAAPVVSTPTKPQGIQASQIKPEKIK